MSHKEFAPDAQGKVRDIFDLGETLLLVATDRISAFDHILKDEIPHKGEVLTALSLFWFDFLKEIVPTHFLTADVDTLPDRFSKQRDYLRGRSMIVKKAEVLPIECIVRGYLAGSGLKEYQKTGTLSGIELSEGLVNSSQFSEPLFTPSTKADQGDHDENISYERMEEIVGVDTAAQLKELSLRIYTAARDHAASKGIIVADTKFEFGLIDGQITLIDEVLTPDSSRFWSAEAYEAGRNQESYDKQIVRNWLELESGWDMVSEPPQLPADIIAKTQAKYEEVYERLTGKKFRSS